MISSLDRSGYFGASDTAMVMSRNMQTRTFLDWWSVKLGTTRSEFHGTRYTEAGNLYEHPILGVLSKEMNLDRQILNEPLKLRVNLDGDLRGTIYEVKTHRASKTFEVSNAYWMQAQVEMFAYQHEFDDFRKHYIVSYPIYEDEYEPEKVEVDIGRIKFTPIEYDSYWIANEYLPRLMYLADCLEERKEP